MSYPYQVNPSVVVPAVFNTSDNSLRSILPQQIYDRALERLSITGPEGSIFKLYQTSVDEQNRLDTTSRGASNTADYPNPIIVPRGATIIGVWTRPANPLAPTDTASVTYFVRQI